MSTPPCMLDGCHRFLFRTFYKIVLNGIGVLRRFTTSPPRQPRAAPQHIGMTVGPKGT